MSTVYKTSFLNSPQFYADFLFTTLISETVESYSGLICLIGLCPPPPPPKPPTPPPKYVVRIFGEQILCTVDQNKSVINQFGVFPAMTQHGKRAEQSRSFLKSAERMIRVTWERKAERSLPRSQIAQCSPAREALFQSQGVA